MRTAVAFVAFLAASVVLVSGVPAQAAVTALEPWEKSKTCRVLALGDSITMGHGDALHNSYRKGLQDRLRYVGFKTEYVGGETTGTLAQNRHEGHSGWTIDKIRAHVDEYMDTYRPDIVLIHLGTNDIAKNLDMTSAPVRLNDLIGKVKSHNPDAVVFVQQITGFLKPEWQTMADQYNAGMRTMSNLGSVNSVYLVSQANIRDIQLWNSSHPNTFGYRQMGWNLYSAFRRVYSGDTWYAGVSPWNEASANVCRLAKCHVYHNVKGAWKR